MIPPAISGRRVQEWSGSGKRDHLIVSSEIFRNSLANFQDAASQTL